MDLTGTWDVVSSPDFDDDYLHLEVEPYVKLYRVGNRIEGEYHLGLQYGDLDGQMKGDNRAVFRFEGMDEMDPVDGTATAKLGGDRLIFVLSYGPGDEYTFECERR
jgi:hypothetical protein